MFLITLITLPKLQVLNDIGHQAVRRCTAICPQRRQFQMVLRLIHIEDRHFSPTELKFLTINGCNAPE